MAKPLEAIEKGNELYFRTGQYTVQLEVPKGSTLVQSDIDRILRISSWERDINGEVDGYEGGRAVLIQKGAPVVNRRWILSALEISGVGFNPDHMYGPWWTWTSKREMLDVNRMLPPSADNYDASPFAANAGNQVADGRVFGYRSIYNPKGSYTESKLRAKIANTYTANALQVDFSVPQVEAYGRYTDLGFGGEQFGFLVTTAPGVGHRRFLDGVIDGFKIKVLNIDSFFHLAQDLGQNFKQLHKAGYAHTMVHLSNLYFNVEQGLHLVDWSTMTQLEGQRIDDLLKRGLDLAIPRASFAAVLEQINMDNAQVRRYLNLFLTVLLSGYYNLDPKRVYLPPSLIPNGYDEVPRELMQFIELTQADI